MENILEVSNLEVSFFTHAGEVHAVRGVSFDLKPGETLAIVGESGCGKTVTAQSIMQLIPMPPGKIKKSSSIRYKDVQLTELDTREMRRLRGSEMGIVFQDPMTSLNPTMTIGRQITEGLLKYQNISQQKADERAIELLRLVGISNPESRLKQYPHELSGGMRQRVMIAIALASDPEFLICDEPTTALDVTIQAQILDLLDDIQERLGTAIIIITHDMGVVARLADRIMVMYGGEVVEAGTVEQIFYEPQHPYTVGLIGSIPRLDRPDRDLFSIGGTPPDLYDPPQGCPFAARCNYTMNICLDEDPELLETGTSHHRSACWLHHPNAPHVPELGRAPEQAETPNQEIEAS